MNAGTAAAAPIAVASERCLTETRAVGAIAEAPRINLLWLLRLRWVAIAGQITIIFAIQILLGFELPQGPLWLVIGVETSTNLACSIWAKRGHPVAEWLLGVLLASDVCFLTALLSLTGGAANPFTFIYLIHVALGAVALRPRWAWAIVALSTLCFGLLFLLPGTHSDADSHHAHHFRMHLEGMWLAFALSAWFIVYFVQRVSGALSLREEELAAARSLGARHERLASLTTLAAGAAHELGSPLATIAIAAKELEHQLEKLSIAGSATEDARLIRTQVERCSAILRQMTHAAGDALGEQPRTVTTGELLAAAVSDLDSRVSVELPSDVASRQLRLPVEAVTLALRNLIKNAIDASPEAEVRIRTFVTAESVRIEIEDRGMGMSSEILERLGEPFFTTKDAGRGMGLGLFLSRSILERMGARLDIRSRAGHGTVATVLLPTPGQQLRA